MLELQAGYGFEERSTSRPRSGSVRDWSASAPRRRSASCSPRCRATTCRINSGLGASPPLNIIVLPVLFEGSVRAVVELASFSPFSVTHQAFLDQLPESIGLVLNTIEANTLTENLLKQSQSLAEELRASRRSCVNPTRTSSARPAASGAEHRGRAEEPGDRAVQAPGRGKGRSGGGILEVQVRVHRQHVPRAPDAPQQPADPGRAAPGQPRHNMTETQVEYASVIRPPATTC